ncbi:hypothetical protein HLI18_21170 [Rhizobium laguerreae]|uniref:hypothetical protein n=1 Tax=Rhizobium laguerreae TaxID=1076926 RepID=UPI0014798226|nr:hypothetical protein [Rhizobium laguerreae]NNG72331.1 hypothetical protein [Rhizobium laguerreae]
MKLAIATATVLMLITTTASSADKQYCKFLGEVATATMKLRQMDTDLTKSMEILSENAPDEANKKLFIDMALMAYDEPAYATEEMQEKAVATFSNKIQLNCYNRN